MMMVNRLCARHLFLQTPKPNVLDYLRLEYSVNKKPLMLNLLQNRTPVPVRCSVKLLSLHQAALSRAI